MTHGDARRLHLPEGHAIRRIQSRGMQHWLADWSRKPDDPMTPYPAYARWFATQAEAASVALLVDMMTGQKWVVSTIPADAKPCRCRTDAQYAYPHGRPCPDCGSDHTARVGDALRCFKCGNAWRDEPSYGPEDDGLTDEHVSMAARAAAETVFPELDDDALDAIEAEIRSELRSVAGTFVP